MDPRRDGFAACAVTGTLKAAITQAVTGAARREIRKGAPQHKTDASGALASSVAQERLNFGSICEVRPVRRCTTDLRGGREWTRAALP